MFNSIDTNVYMQIDKSDIHTYTIQLIVFIGNAGAKYVFFFKWRCVIGKIITI